MFKKSLWLIVLIDLFVVFSTGYSNTPIRDENGNATELINVNPDPDGEPWISGGGRALTEEEQNCIPDLVLPKHYEDREKYPLPSKVDNSRTKYFPPIFTQKGASCCQASGISYAFTYEVCRKRDLEAKKKENIYPYGFAYNFLNKGKTSTYSMYFDGWYMSEELGIPNLVDYGGTLEGTASQTSWLDGYDKYYRAMHNRYIESFKINSATTNGIETMKQWLYDHTNGSRIGGVLCFLAWSGQTKATLPSNSPEAGHVYIKKFGTSGGHCMTIVGYHDDIIFDLNNDGVIGKQEKGGFLMVNSYGTNFGTQGRAYIPYKLFLNGSMKSKYVHGINVKQSFKPLLTYKVSVTHNQRNQIKIIRGFSTDLSANTPSKIYKYKECFGDGGALPMEGKGLSQTIEVGLDISEFVKEIAGNKAKFFLQIESKGGSGKVNNFSVLDYTAGKVKEYQCSQTDVAINSGTTTLSVICDATKISKDSYKDRNRSRLFYVASLRNRNTILFKFNASHYRQAVFSIVTIQGQLLYKKALLITPENSFSWDITNNAGNRVANGKYIAKLLLIDNKGENRILYTPVYVME